MKRKIALTVLLGITCVATTILAFRTYSDIGANHVGKYTRTGEGSVKAKEDTRATGNRGLDVFIHEKF